MNTRSLTHADGSEATRQGTSRDPDSAERRGVAKWARRVVPIGIAVFYLVIYFGTRVTREVTEEDGKYIELILGDELPESHPSLSFDEQIELIQRIQAAVLAVAPINKMIPYGQTRHPKDLYLAGHGLCFDRSWVIEKTLIAFGFDVRHVAIYRAQGNRVPWLVLAIPGVQSHAVTEVRTSRGWLMVDSNRRWISLSQSLQPISMSMIREVGAGSIEWSSKEYAPILGDEFVFVYGLYSRHGSFFSPFIPLPDLHWRDLMSHGGLGG